MAAQAKSHDLSMVSLESREAGGGGSIPARQIRHLQRCPRSDPGAEPEIHRQVRDSFSPRDPHVLGLGHPAPEGSQWPDWSPRPPGQSSTRPSRYLPKGGDQGREMDLCRASGDERDPPVGEVRSPPRLRHLPQYPEPSGQKNGTYIFGLMSDWLAILA